MKRTYESTSMEIERLEAEQHKLLNRGTEADKGTVLKAQGQIDQLRKIQNELYAAEKQEFREAVARSVPVGGLEYSDPAREDLRTYLRTGDAQNSSMGDTSVFTVPEPLIQELVDKVYNESPIYSNARVFKLDQGQSPVIYLPTKESHSTVTWAASDVATRAETTAPTFGQVKLEAIDIYDYVWATQTLLDSSDIEKIILDDLAGSIMQGMNGKFCIGTGSNEPLGIFANVSGDNAYTAVASGSNDALVAAKLIEAAHTLPSAYQPRAKWYMAPATLSTIAQMSRGTTLTTYPLIEYGPNGSVQMLGKPVVLVDDAPAIGNGAYPVAYGDLSKGYAIAEHRGFSVLRNPFDPPYVKFYGMTRVNGTPWDNQAIVLCKSDA
ncbi:MAG: phage major capsid protein [Coriobacteriia bacterium]|nr:phage major capsid protein [Coriobacteriia bacterium]